jgi:hypothetical protein
MISFIVLPLVLVYTRLGPNYFWRVVSSTNDSLVVSDFLVDAHRSGQSPDHFVLREDLVREELRPEVRLDRAG